MNRLTKLDRNVYHPTPTGAQFLEPDDGSNAARLLQIIGSYEDLMEKYGIKDTKDLDERLGIYQALADHDYTAIDKPAYEAMMSDISKYREAEKESNISLITLSKALVKGIYTKKFGYYDGSLLSFQGDCFVVGGGYDTYVYYFKDYGKTWALTKEELQ